jgi:predicted N-acetyltransferase YhbS
MTLDVRRVRDEDELASAYRTIHAVFGETLEERNIERARKTMPYERVHVALDGDSIVGVALAFPFSMTIPGGELPVGGVTWVAVQPTHRRRGVASGLMRAQLDDRPGRRDSSVARRRSSGSRRCTSASARRDRGCSAAPRRGGPSCGCIRSRRAA